MSHTADAQPARDVATQAFAVNTRRPDGNNYPHGARNRATRGTKQAASSKPGRDAEAGSPAFSIYGVWWLGRVSASPQSIVRDFRPLIPAHGNRRLHGRLDGQSPAVGLRKRHQSRPFPSRAATGAVVPIRRHTTPGPHGGQYVPPSRVSPSAAQTPVH